MVGRTGWCRFFKLNNFLVGRSLDGPRGMHDAYRVDKSGKPTFDKAMSAAKLFRKHKVYFNILTTVCAANGDYPLEVYRFLRNDVRDVGKIFVQIFDAFLAAWAGDFQSICIFSQTCGTAPALEHNGDLYSCDHFVDREYLLGNIGKESMGRLASSEKQRRFGRSKLDSLPKYCLRCEVMFVCNGECPKNRFTKTPDGDPGLNYLCAGYR